MEAPTAEIQSQRQQSVFQSLKFSIVNISSACMATWFKTSCATANSSSSAIIISGSSSLSNVPWSSGPATRIESATRWPLEVPEHVLHNLVVVRCVVALGSFRDEHQMLALHEGGVDAHLLRRVDPFELSIVALLDFFCQLMAHHSPLEHVLLRLP